jgi:6-phosphogluconolactonase (cycloisomerase 2 family)
MSFLRAARAALAGPSCFPPIFAAAVVILAGLLLSCGSSSSHLPHGPSHNAYVTLPAKGSVMLLHINGATGAITLGGSTPQVQDTSPTGLALAPSKKFLYAVNSGSNTGIAIFNVASDGSLTLSGTPHAAGNGPDLAVIDPSGKYLLVTNNIGSNGSGGDISVYSIDSGSGDLTEVPGSPFAANADPTSIVFTHSGKFVYVTNPVIGTVTGFVFDPTAATILTQLPSSPIFSGQGAGALAVDGSDSFLYVANFSDPNPLLSTQGNISGFAIDPNTGALTLIPGSPFTSSVGNNPSAITVDPSGRFVYAATAGSSFSIWCFSITSPTGQLSAVTNSPFSLSAGGQFALFDPSGNYLYIGNQAGNGVSGYTYNPSTGAPTVISGSPFATGAPGAMVLSE